MSTRITKIASDDSRRFRVRGGIVLVLLAVLSLVATPAAAQQPQPTTPTTLSPEDQKNLEATLALAPESPPSPDDPFVAPIEARKIEVEKGLALMAAEQRVVVAYGEVIAANTEVDKAKAAESKAKASRTRADANLRKQREQLGDLSVQAYVTGGEFEVASMQALLDGDTTDPAGSATVLFAEVVDHQEEVTVKATNTAARAKKRLTAATAVRVDKTGLAGSAAERLSARTAERDAAKAAHDRAVADFEAAKSKLANAPRKQTVPTEVAIIGMPRLSAEDLAAWFESSSYRSKIATPIADIARWFIEEGKREGIRGDIAFAQAVLETGGFTNNDSVRVNNYSGIGHCDTCPSGWAFPTAQDGVRAQIQLLKSYTMRNPTYTQPLVDRRLRGPAGCCTTWGALTKKWATDPNYGPVVMMVYSSIVDHALGRRAAGIGMDTVDVPV